jgi:hypothetical protein
MAKKFNTDEIAEFLRLKKREGQLIRWQESIAEEQAKLERQKRHQQDELAELQATLEKRFAALNDNLELFSLSDVPDSAVIELNPSGRGVSEEKKRLLLPAILEDYKATHPDAENVPFRWIKAHLEDKYKVKCKSISNFFVGLLDEYELAGGNRNRSVVLPK